LLVLETGNSSQDGGGTIAIKWMLNAHVQGNALVEGAEGGGRMWWFQVGVSTFASSA